MLSRRPSQERLVVCSSYNNVSFDVGKGMPIREQTVKVSFDVGNKTLRREQQMEEIRMSSINMLYDEGHESSQILSSFDTIQLEDFSSMFGKVCDEIWSEDVNLQLHAATQIEKSLPFGRECPPALVEKGLVQRFVCFLMRDNFLDLQYEAGWALIKIFCGTCKETKAELFREALPCFVRLLDSPSDDVCELAVFALGIFADDSLEYRDRMLCNEVVAPLLKQLKKHANLGKHATLSMLRNVTWALSVFCEKISYRYDDLLKPALRTLECLFHSDDEEVLIHSAWAIQSLSFVGSDSIDALMDAGLCPILVKHFLHSSRRVRYPVLMTVSHIALGRTYIQALIDNGAIGHLLTLLNDEDRRSKKQTCRVIRGILCGNELQIQAVINGKLIGPLVKLLESADMDIQMVAAEAISKATSYGSQKQIKYLVDEYKIINYLYLLISSPNTRTAKLGLQVVQNLLMAGGGGACPCNPYRKLIVEEAKCVVEEIQKIRSSGGCRLGYEGSMKACYLVNAVGFKK